MTPARKLPLLADIDNDPRGAGRLESATGGQLPLVAMDLRAAVSGLVAECVVTQTFVNTYDEPIECTYIFPLPDRAAVTRFEMRVAGGVVKGVLKERGEARRAYQRAISEGKRAAISEEERAGTFSLRVGNLQPGEEAVVELVMVSVLAVDDGEATFRFPLVVAPRYTPGTPLAAPNVGLGTANDTDRVRDASRVTPPVRPTLDDVHAATMEPTKAPLPPKLTIRCDLSTLGLAVDDVRSSLHTIVVEQSGDGTVQKLAVDAGAAIDRDFVLRFKVGADKTTSSLRVIPDGGGGDDATIVLALAPPAHVATTRRPVDVVFLLDTSGSMAGWKMSAAKQALSSMVETLSAGDRLRVYGFNDGVRTHGDADKAELLDVDAKVKKHALSFIASLHADGGTEMQRPLEVGLDVLAGGYAERERVVVLITDGQVTNEAELVRALEGRMKGTRIFAVGIDDAVNSGLLTRLAVVSGGLCELVESEARLDDVLDRLHRRLRTPALSEIAIAFDGVALSQQTMTPARLPPLFPGLPMLVLARGRLTSKARPNVEPEVRALVTGVGGGGVVERFDVTGVVERLPGMKSAWARSVVRDLEDRFDRGYTDVRARLTKLSLDENVLCRFTAFVAVDDRKLAKPKPDKPLRQVVQVVAPKPSPPPTTTTASTTVATATPPAFVPSRPARLGELLLRENLITLAQLQRAQEEHKREGGKLGHHLTKLGFVDDGQIAELLSKQYGVPAINLGEFEIDDDVIKLVPKEVAEKHLVVPVNRAGASLIVAMVDPSNIFAIDDIKFLTGYNVEVVVASEPQVHAAIEKYYTRSHHHDALSGINIDDMLVGFEDDGDDDDESERETGGELDGIEEADVADDRDAPDDDADALLPPPSPPSPPPPPPPLAGEKAGPAGGADVVDLEHAGADLAIVKLVNLILVDALKKNATLIVIGKVGRALVVSYRIDGVFHEVMKPPQKLWDAIAARVLAMASMTAQQTHGVIDVRFGGGRRARYDVVVLTDGAIVIGGVQT